MAVGCSRFRTPNAWHTGQTCELLHHDSGRSLLVSRVPEAGLKMCSMKGTQMSNGFQGSYVATTIEITTTIEIVISIVVENASHRNH